MSTSPLQGRLLTGYAPEGVDNDACSPIGASIARDYVLNNLCHYADEFAQVRVAWTATVGTYSGGQGYVSAPATVDFSKLWTSPTFPIPLRADGSSYRMRVRIAGAISAGVGTATFRVVLGPPGGSRLAVTAGDYAFETQASSTTAAWLTGASLGPENNASLIYLPSSLIGERGWVRPETTLSDLGGTPRTVDQCLVCLTVYAKSSDLVTPGIPRLYGLYAAEWVGPPGSAE